MTNPDPLDPTVRRYAAHPEIALGYDETFARNPLFAYDLAFVLEHVTPGSRVLDLGCGTGRHVVALARTGCRVTGVDLSETMLRVAAGKLAGRKLPAALLRADMLALPFDAQAGFEAILLMFSTLGLVTGFENRRLLLARLAALAVPGGRLLFHVHNDRYRDSPHLRLPARLRDGWKRLHGYEPGDHLISGYRGLLDLRLHSFSLLEVESLLARSGWRLLYLEGLNGERDGPCGGNDPDRDANGFLVMAQRRDG